MLRILDDSCYMNNIDILPARRNENIRIYKIGIDRKIWSRLNFKASRTDTSTENRACIDQEYMRIMEENGFQMYTETELDDMYGFENNRPNSAVDYIEGSLINDPYNYTTLNYDFYYPNHPELFGIDGIENFSHYEDCYLALILDFSDIEVLKKVMNGYITCP